MPDHGAAAVIVALGTFERAREWADLVTCLQRLSSALRAHAPLPALPQPVALARWLEQCLHVVYPSGVHMQALDAYDAVVSSVSPASLVGQLDSFGCGELLVSGILQVFAHGTTQVRRRACHLLVTHVGVLGDALAACARGAVAALVPAANDADGDLAAAAAGALAVVCVRVPASVLAAHCAIVGRRGGDVGAAALAWAATLAGPAAGAPGGSLPTPQAREAASSAVCAILSRADVLSARAALDYASVWLFDDRSENSVAGQALDLAVLHILLRRDKSLARRAGAWLARRAPDAIAAAVRAAALARRNSPRSLARLLRAIRCASDRAELCGMFATPAIQSACGRATAQVLSGGDAHASSGRSPAQGGGRHDGDACGAVSQSSLSKGNDAREAVESIFAGLDVACEVTDPAAFPVPDGASGQEDGIAMLESAWAALVHCVGSDAAWKGAEASLIGALHPQDPTLRVPPHELRAHIALLLDTVDGAPSERLFAALLAALDGCAPRSMDVLAVALLSSATLCLQVADAALRHEDKSRAGSTPWRLDWRWRRWLQAGKSSSTPSSSVSATPTPSPDSADSLNRGFRSEQTIQEVPFPAGARAFQRDAGKAERESDHGGRSSPSIADTAQHDPRATVERSVPSAMIALCKVVNAHLCEPHLPQTSGRIVSIGISLVLRFLCCESARGETARSALAATLRACFEVTAALSRSPVSAEDASVSFQGGSWENRDWMESEISEEMCAPSCSEKPGRAVADSDAELSGPWARGAARGAGSAYPVRNGTRSGAHVRRALGNRGCFACARAVVYVISRRQALGSRCCEGECALTLVESALARDGVALSDAAAIAAAAVWDSLRQGPTSETAVAASQILADTAAVFPRPIAALASSRVDGNDGGIAVGTLAALVWPRDGRRAGPQGRGVEALGRALVRPVAALAAASHSPSTPQPRDRTVNVQPSTAAYTGAGMKYEAALDMLVEHAATTVVAEHLAREAASCARRSDVERAAFFLSGAAGIIEHCNAFASKDSVLAVLHAVSLCCAGNPAPCVADAAAALVGATVAAVDGAVFAAAPLVLALVRSSAATVPLAKLVDRFSEAAARAAISTLDGDNTGRGVSPSFLQAKGPAEESLRDGVQSRALSDSARTAAARRPGPDGSCAGEPRGDTCTDPDKPVLAGIGVYESDRCRLHFCCIMETVVSVCCRLVLQSGAAHTTRLAAIRLAENSLQWAATILSAHANVTDATHHVRPALRSALCAAAFLQACSTPGDVPAADRALELCDRCTCEERAGLAGGARHARASKLAALLCNAEYASFAIDAASNALKSLCPTLVRESAGARTLASSCVGSLDCLVPALGSSSAGTQLSAAGAVLLSLSAVLLAPWSEDEAGDNHALSREGAPSSPPAMPRTEEAGRSAAVQEADCANAVHGASVASAETGTDMRDAGDHSDDDADAGDSGDLTAMSDSSRPVRCWSPVARADSSAARAAAAARAARALSEWFDAADALCIPSLQSVAVLAARATPRRVWQGSPGAASPRGIADALRGSAAATLIRAVFRATGSVSPSMLSVVVDGITSAAVARTDPSATHSDDRGVSRHSTDARSAPAGALAKQAAPGGSGGAGLPIPPVLFVPAVHTDSLQHVLDVPAPHAGFCAWTAASVAIPRAVWPAVERCAKRAVLPPWSPDALLFAALGMRACAAARPRWFDAPAGAAMAAQCRAVGVALMSLAGAAELADAPKLASGSAYALAEIPALAADALAALAPSFSPAFFADHSGARLRDAVAPLGAAAAALARRGGAAAAAAAAVPSSALASVMAALVGGNSAPGGLSTSAPAVSSDGATVRESWPRTREDALATACALRAVTAYARVRGGAALAPWAPALCDALEDPIPFGSASACESWVSVARIALVVEPERIVSRVAGAAGGGGASGVETVRSDAGPAAGARGEGRLSDGDVAAIGCSVRVGVLALRACRKRRIPGALLRSCVALGTALLRPLSEGALSWARNGSGHGSASDVQVSTSLLRARRRALCLVRVLIETVPDDEPLEGLWTLVHLEVRTALAEAVRAGELGASGEDSPQPDGAESGGEHSRRTSFLTGLLGGAARESARQQDGESDERMRARGDGTAAVAAWIEASLHAGAVLFRRALIVQGSYSAAIADALAPAFVRASGQIARQSKRSRVDCVAPALQEVRSHVCTVAECASSGILPPTPRSAMQDIAFW